MSKNGKKRHLGCIIFPVFLLVIVVGLFLGKDLIISNVKAAAAKTVAKKMLEEKFGSLLGDVDVSEIVDNISEEDIQKVTDIAEKYVDAEKINQYIDMAKDGNLSEVKQYVNEQLSEQDKQELQGLYEKYKDQIPVDQLPIDQIPLDQIPLDQLPID